jgi:hypothetical protein
MTTVRNSEWNVALLLWVCFVVTSATAALAAGLPYIPITRDNATSSLRQNGIVNGLRLGIINIKLEATLLSQLRRNFPNLKLRTQSDASESETWLCFTLATRQGRVQVWPSSGEVGGGEFIDGVYAQGGESWPLKDCPIIDIGNGAIGIDGRIWIGTSKSSLLRRLGRPSSTSGQVMIYNYQVAIRDPRLGECWITEELLFDMKDSRVSRLSVTKDTGC